MLEARDWDAAFNNMAHVSGSADLIPMWAKRATSYRVGVRIEEDVAYGDAMRARYDLIWPDGDAQGLAVFVHGGYWMRLSKSDWTDLAEGARAQGWAVCVPSYTLAPDARIGAITQQITRAISHAAGRVGGPIRLAGHSAGGHLVSRMLCADTGLAGDVLARIEHVVSISGLHDLRPLMHTDMNQVLRLDMAEAMVESPVLHLPVEGAKLTCWVGGGELPEFVRQAELMAQMWDGLGAQTRCVIDGTHNHFTVVEGLKDPGSALSRAFVGTS